MKKRVYRFLIPGIVVFIVLASALAAGLITLTRALATLFARGYLAEQGKTIVSTPTGR